MNCSRDFIAQKWTASKQSVIIHLREDHDLVLDGQRFWCDICKSDIGGKRVSYHRCFRNRSLVKTSNQTFRFSLPLMQHVLYFSKRTLESPEGMLGLAVALALYLLLPLRTRLPLIESYGTLCPLHKMEVLDMWLMAHLWLMVKA